MLLGHLVNAVVKNSEGKTTTDPVFTDYYLLTNVLAKFICGQGYMMVYAHLQVTFYQKIDYVHS